MVLNILYINSVNILMNLIISLFKKLETIKVADNIRHNILKVITTELSLILTGCFTVATFCSTELSSVNTNTLRW